MDSTNTRHLQYQGQEHDKASSLRCEIKIIRAKNLEFLSSGNVFVRIYLVLGKGKKIRLNSREIESSTYDPRWNEQFSLECKALSWLQPLEELRQQKVLFELRWRSSSPVYDKIVGSKLLGKAEMAWKGVIDADDKQIEKWFPLMGGHRLLPAGMKPPALQLAMRVRDTMEAGKKVDRRRKLPPKNWEKCGCLDDSCSAQDDDIFALAAALDY